MSHGKQFTLYTHKGGPNGWLVVISMLSVACRILTNNADDRKVVFVLEELGLTYESIYLDFASGENKKPEYTQYNPNGRIPQLSTTRTVTLFFGTSSSPYASTTKGLNFSDIILFGI